MTIGDFARTYGVSPWTLRNWLVYRAVVPVSIMSGRTLWEGNTNLTHDQVFRRYRAVRGRDAVMRQYGVAVGFAMDNIRSRQPWWFFEKAREQMPRFWAADNLALIHMERGAYAFVTPDALRLAGVVTLVPQPGAERPVPPRAQAAHQMAATVAENLRMMMEGRSLKDFIYDDRGSLVSLSRYSTVGNLMGALVGGQLAIEGRIARFIYLSLYRMHLIAIHGWIKGLALIAVGTVNRIVRLPPFAGKVSELGLAKMSGSFARAGFISPPPSRRVETSPPPGPVTGSPVSISADLICATVQPG